MSSNADNYCSKSREKDVKVGETDVGCARESGRGGGMTSI